MMHWNVVRDMFGGIPTLAALLQQVKAVLVHSGDVSPGNPVHGSCASALSLLVGEAWDLVLCASPLLNLVTNSAAEVEGLRRECGHHNSERLCSCFVGVLSGLSYLGAVDVLPAYSQR
eukprot:TRINITY_DN6840_c2_g1_i1.p1 TRINITY_DN6840_c2_g1~~TRINITY_DN6840_c2_g1_i1.p1  ORF type:complete len:118 (-),score=21.37 TRINITY_DN6840_c2_g1_i1:61-414(-)